MLKLQRDAEHPGRSDQQVKKVSPYAALRRDTEIPTPVSLQRKGVQARYFPFSPAFSSPPVHSDLLTAMRSGVTASEFIALLNRYEPILPSHACALLDAFQERLGQTAWATGDSMWNPEMADEIKHRLRALAGSHGCPDQE